MGSVIVHILGLKKNQVCDCLDTFFDEAMGRQLTLRPEPSNPFDNRAISVFDWRGRLIGRVAKDDKDWAWGELEKTGLKSIRTGRVVSMDREHPCLFYEIFTQGEPKKAEYKTEVFTQWSYEGPVLRSTPELDELDYLVDEIPARLMERDRWTDEDRELFMILVNSLIARSKLDISGDMAQSRVQICMLLKDAGFGDMADRLNRMTGHIGYDCQDGEVYDYWMSLLGGMGLAKMLVERRQTVDVEQLKEQLLKFPEDIYHDWHADPARFLARVYYMHMPREVLLRLMSAIILTEESQEPEADAKAPATGANACFWNTSDFVRGKVIEAVRAHYMNSNVNLAMINVTFFDHGLLRHRNQYRLLIRTLIDWGALPKDTDMKAVASGMAEKLKEPFPKDGYKDWSNIYLNNRKTCEAIAATLGPSIKYAR